MAIVLDGAGNDIVVNGVSVATDTEVSSAIAPLAPLASPSFTGPISAKDLSYKSTPVTITSWSYSGTTITLNVASHTFVAGDYVEVFGLTATTYPANGIQLVISVTATTIVFTLGATPTGTAGVSSATVKGYATVNGRVSASIGVNQTWQDVSASRILGTTYTNSTGNPILISCFNISSAIASYADLTINGKVIAQNGIITGAGYYYFVCGICPNGGTYSLSANGASQKWFELR